MSEICMQCGHSVAWGSGRYVNRIPDCNTEEVRKDMGVPYPEGDFRCIDCEEKYLQENGKLCQVCDNYELDVDSWEGFEAICQTCKSDMEKAIKNIQHEEWACWTLFTEDIVGSAKQKGISLVNKNIDNIARLVKKGIDAAVEGVWEQVIEQAISDTKVEWWE